MSIRLATLQLQKIQGGKGARKGERERVGGRRGRRKKGKKGFKKSIFINML